MEDLDGFGYLPEEFRVCLRMMRITKATLSDYYALTRAMDKEKQIVIFYYIFGSKEQVARLLKTSTKRVRRAVELFIVDGEFPKPLPMGRPSKKTMANIARIEALVIADHTSSITSIQQKLSLSNITMSRQTIDEILHLLRFEFKPPKQRQKLTCIHIENRMRFAFSMVANDLLDFDIIFSDESRFALNSDRKWVWRRRGDVDDSVFADKVKFPVSCMVWGAIGRNFRSRLFFCDNSVDSPEYVHILKASRLFDEADAAYGEGAYIFQQDGATPHTAKTTVRWITNRAHLLNHWPANSPDLNPIENVWSIMKQRLRTFAPTTEEEMKDCLQTTWNTIDQSVLDRLSTSLRYRLHLMILRRRSGHRTLLASWSWT